MWLRTDGFRDGEGDYLTSDTHRGVWLADVPLDANEGAKGEHVLVVDVPESVVAPYEWIEDEKTYREFLVPAAAVNGYSVVDTFSIYSERFWDEREG
jgi:hypothetical protein